jgi:hypothetical protein
LWKYKLNLFPSPYNEGGEAFGARFVEPKRFLERSGDLAE